MSQSCTAKLMQKGEISLSNREGKVFKFNSNVFLYIKEYPNFFAQNEDHIVSSGLQELQILVHVFSCT